MVGCPDCDADLDTTDTIDPDDEPLDGYWISCSDSDCDFETVLTVLQYNWYDYEAISEIHDDSTCTRCRADGDWLVERQGVTSTRYCDGCMPHVFRAVYRDTVRRLVRK